MRDVGAGMRFVLALAVPILLVVPGGPAWGQAVPGAAVTKTVVLNTYGIWRFHCTLEPPVLPSGKAVKVRHVWLEYKTSGPGADWMNPDFDDQFSNSQS